MSSLSILARRLLQAHHGEINPADQEPWPARFLRTHGCPRAVCGRQPGALCSSAALHTLPLRRASQPQAPAEGNTLLLFLWTKELHLRPAQLGRGLSWLCETRSMRLSLPALPTPGSQRFHR